MAPGGEKAIVVEVIRTGGLAGLRREWRAAPPPDATRRWVILIERCPWDAADAADPKGADRFQWFIRARAGAERRILSAARAGGFTQGDVLETMLARGQVTVKAKELAHAAIDAAGTDAVVAIMQSLRP